MAESIPEPSLSPSLLVAMPQLLDPNFKRSVVLLVHHDAEGSFGLVINRASEIVAPQLCESLELAWHGDEEDVVMWGGPVQPNTGWVLFGDGTAADAEESTVVTNGLRFAGSLETLRCIAQSPPERVRLLLGYAGWGPGQLEVELTQGAWVTVPIDPNMVFETPPEALWDRVLRSLGIDPATLIATPGIH